MWRRPPQPDVALVLEHGQQLTSQLCISAAPVCMTASSKLTALTCEKPEVLGGLGSAPVCRDLCKDDHLCRLL